MTTPNNAAALERLAAIGELIRTQDNRITDAPIFIVQQKREYVAHPDYDHDLIAWFDGDGEANEEEAAALEAQYKDTHREPAGWTRAPVGYYWDFVTACFTEQGCKDYIARDGHNLREPRIYAAGSYRNEEWRAVREYLATLTQPDATRPRAIWPDALSSPERHQLRVLLECVDRRVLSPHEADQLVNLIADALTSQPSGEIDIEALRSMWRALIDAGGATTVARHGVERGGVEWAHTVTNGMLAIERHLHPERFDDFPTGKATHPSADAPGVNSSLRVAALALADLAERNTDDLDLWQAAIDAVRNAADAPGVAVECERQIALYRKFVNDLDDSTEYARAAITRSELRKMFADLTAALAPKPEGDL